MGQSRHEAVLSDSLLQPLNLLIHPQQQRDNDLMALVLDRLRLSPLHARGFAVGPLCPPDLTERLRRIVMGHLGGSASVEIDAPLEKVWAVIEDVMAAPEWQGGLDKVTAFERDPDGRPTLVDSEADIKVMRVKSRVRICYEGPTRLSWTQEEGDMKSVEAVWELEDLGKERTRVRYSFHVDPGRVLGLVIRGPVEAAMRAIFLNGRPRELRRRVEGG